LGEDSALTRQAVNIRCLNFTACKTTAKRRDVIDAKIIGENKNDIGRTVFI